MNDQQGLEILARAMSEHIGLVLSVSNFAQARSRLHAIREREKVPGMESLEFREWTGGDGNMVIVRARGREGASDEHGRGRPRGQGNLARASRETADDLDL